MPDAQILRRLILLFLVPCAVAGIWASAPGVAPGDGLSHPAAVAQSGNPPNVSPAGPEAGVLRDHDVPRYAGAEDSPVTDRRAAVDPSILVFEPRGGPQTAQVTALAVDPTNAQIAYAGTATGAIYKTTDGGICWRPADKGIPSGFPVTSLAMDPLNPEKIFAGVLRAGIFNTIDAGATWTLSLSQGFRPESFRFDVAIAATDPSIVYATATRSSGFPGAWYKSKDGGETWVKGPTFGLPSTVILAIAVDPTNPSTVYLGSDFQGILKTTDGGGTWNRLTEGLPSNSFIRALAIHPSNPSTLYTATNKVIFKSIDAGMSWTSTNSGLPAGTTADSLVINPADPSTLYAATSSGFAKSVSGGGSWTILSSLPNSPFLSFFVLFRPLAISPSNRQVIYAGSSAGILKSMNAGASWASIDSGILGAQVGDVIIHPTTSTIYAGTFGGSVFKSANEGGTWNSGGSMSNPFVNVLALDPTNGAVLYAGTQFGGILKSSNGGGTWEEVNSGLSFESLPVASLAIDPNNTQTLYAGTLGGGRGRLFKSLSGGETWTGLSGLPIMSGITSIVIDWANPSVVYAATQGRDLTAPSIVIRSADEGMTWATSSLPITTISPIRLVQHPFQRNVIYAAALDRGIWKSSDSGANWALTSSGLPPFSIIVDLDIDRNSPEVLYATIQSPQPGAIYKTTNGGATWAPLGNTGLQAPLRPKVLTLDPGNPSRLYLGTLHRGVFRSDDGGMTWRPTGAPSITSLPLTAVPGSEITVTGSGFLDGCLQIFINGIPVTAIRVLSDSVATFVVPYLIPGPADVVLSTSGGSVTLPAGPSGFVVVAAIPTLSEWGIALLAAALLGAGVYTLRRVSRTGFPA